MLNAHLISKTFGTHSSVSRHGALCVAEVLLLLGQSSTIMGISNKMKSSLSPSTPYPLPVLRRLAASLQYPPMSSHRPQET